MRYPLLVLISVAASATACLGQLPQTRLYSLFPPGVPPGQITDVRINTGADLDEINHLWFSHPGIFATPKQQPDGQGGYKPVANVFRVAVEANVPAGQYEVRAAGLFGTSNARTILVDPRPALAETEPNSTPQQAQSVDVGTLVDGQINGAGDVDVFRFSARQGERVILDCLAERLGSQLNPLLTVSDADARPIEFARNEYGRDAFLVLDVRADGDFFVEVRDETFAGGAEHFYRLQIHRGPHVRFVMPPAGVAGTTGRHTLYGYNLPGSAAADTPTPEAPLEQLEVEITAPQVAQPICGIPSLSAGLDFFSYQLQTDAGASNRVLLGLSTSPMTLETPVQNDDSTTIQTLAIPFEVSGQLVEPLETDRYEFEAVKGDQLWIEVIGQRSGARVDPFLTIDQVTINSDGVESIKAIAAEDDTSTNLAPNTFDTATDDPAYLWTVPETGRYRLSLRDRQSVYEPDPTRIYRLIVRRPQPDFRLVAVPAGQVNGLAWPISPRRGDHVAMDVLVFRRDGFAGSIEVRPVELPPGITTPGTRIADQQNAATLVLTASENAPGGLAPIRLVGSALVSTSEGETLVERPVLSGTVLWNRNGNVPAIAQLESSLLGSVTQEAAPYQITFDFGRTTVHQGRQLLIPMSLDRRSFDEKLTLKFDGVARNAKIDTSDIVFEKGQDAQTCRLFIRPDAPAGTYVIGGTCEAQVPYVRNPLLAEAAEVRKLIAKRNAETSRTAANIAARSVDSQARALNQASEALTQAEAAAASAREQAEQSRQMVATLMESHGDAVKRVAALTETSQKLMAQLGDVAPDADLNVEPQQSDGQIKQLRESLEQNQTALGEAQQEQKRTQEQLASAQEKHKQAQESLLAADASVQQAKTEMQQAQARLEQRKNRLQEAESSAKAAAEALAAAEKAASDAANAAKPKNVAVNQPVPPLIVTISPAPIELDAKPAMGKVTVGETVDVAVTVKRKNEFNGPVRLSLAIPEGVTGLTAPEVEVPADADSAVLQVTASADSPIGPIANLVVQATMDAGGEAIVDAPFPLEVTK